VEIDTNSGHFLRLIRELVILIVGTLVLSALVTPSLYVGLDTALGGLPWPYSRVFDRVAMVAAVVILVLRRRHYELIHYRSQFISMVEAPRLKPIVLGFCLSFFLSLAALPFLVQQGTLVWSDHSTGALAWRFTKTLPAALLISLIEETFFRFFLFLSLRRYLPFIFAAGASSLLYAVVHFIQPEKSWAFSELEISTGFSYLALLLERFTYDGFLSAAFGLFMIGILLCMTVERSRSLLPALGLHAGWVATTKVIGRLVGAAPGFSYPPGAGRRYYLLTEEVSWIAIVIVGLVAYFIFTSRKSSLSDEQEQCP
jgi:membrane protease YdiL (CAAX protease family)